MDVSMDEEEESMEISGGESNFDNSNLLRYNFDVSWSESLSQQFHSSVQARDQPSRNFDRFSTSSPNPSSWKSTGLPHRPTTGMAMNRHCTTTSTVVNRPGLTDSPAFWSVSSPISRERISSESCQPSTVIQEEAAQKQTQPQTEDNNRESQSRDTPKNETLISALKSKDKAAKESFKVKQVVSGKKVAETNKTHVSVYVSVISLCVCVAGILIYFHMLQMPCPQMSVSVQQLQQNLREDVFGQHIAVSTILSAITGFSQSLTQTTTRQSITLSLHGWTGVGKNYVSKFITDAFPSSKVAWFLVPLDFPHEDADERYQREVEHWIIGNLTTCGSNIFIFDELDKARASVLTGLRNVLEAVGDISTGHKITEPEVNPRLQSSVFIFLSNAKAAKINQYLFTQTTLGRPRKSLQLKEFSPLFEEAITKEWYKDLHSEGLIDYYVPFLPLGEEHVKMCIVREFIKRGVNPGEEKVAAVLHELSFFELSNTEMYSQTGCKRVQDKVDLFIED